MRACPSRSRGWLGPSVEFLLAAGVEAEAPGQALNDGVLSLDRLSPAGGAGLIGGRCLLLPRMDEVTIEGSPPADAGRLLVIATGDAVLGSPGETLRLSGGIVVGGCLEVRGPVVIEGSLHAGSLRVQAPTAILVAPGGGRLPSRAPRCRLWWRTGGEHAG